MTPPYIHEWYSAFNHIRYRLRFQLFQFRLKARDNNAEGIVFRKRFNKQETFSGGWKTSKSNLKTYFRNLEKIIFCSEIYDFVIKFRNYVISFERKRPQGRHMAALLSLLKAQSEHSKIWCPLRIPNTDFAHDGDTGGCYLVGQKLCRRSIMFPEPLFSRGFELRKFVNFWRLFFASHEYFAF